MELKQRIRQEFEEAQDVLSRFLSDDNHFETIARAARLMSDAFSKEVM